MLAGLQLCYWHTTKSGPEVIKLFPCSTQLSMKFIQLINIKMPLIVGILIFISMINTTSERLKARKVFIFTFSILLAVEISCSVEYEKSFITLEPGFLTMWPINGMN